jgi:XTP/dITP diphosphohydrolase
MPMRFILASGNRHKLTEIGAILTPYAVEAMPGDIELPPEGSESFRVNAHAKAHALAEALRERDALPEGTYVIADDSGLEVEALDWGPGVTSSRYAGVEGDDAANNAKLLRELAAVTDPAARRARFVCVMACVTADGEEFDVRGEWPGTIAAEPRGEGGFGYDPLVVPDGETRSVAELADDEKNAASHRARAGRALLAALTGVP